MKCTPLGRHLKKTSFVLEYTFERGVFLWLQKDKNLKKHSSDMKKIILDRYLKGESSISLGKGFWYITKYYSNLG